MSRGDTELSRLKLLAERGEGDLDESRESFVSLPPCSLLSSDALGRGDTGMSRPDVRVGTTFPEPLGETGGRSVFVRDDLGLLPNIVPHAHSPSKSDRSFSDFFFFFSFFFFFRSLFKGLFRELERCTHISSL
jgi:hypothetical protein